MLKQMRKSGNSRLVVERLESRMMLSAAAVQVRLDHGTLIVRGTNAADVIFIDENPAGTFEVFTATGGNELPVDPLTFRGVRNIKIEAKGGDDLIILGSGAVPTSLPCNPNVAFTPVLSISGELKVEAGNGNDTIIASEMAIGKSAKFSGGNGFDLIDVAASSFGKNLEIEAGSCGNKIVLAKGNCVRGEMEVETGRGNDFVTLLGDTVGKKLEVETGAGADQLYAILGAADIATVAAALETFLSTPPNDTGFASALAFAPTPIDPEPPFTLNLVNFAFDEMTAVSNLIFVPTAAARARAVAAPVGSVASITAREVEIETGSGDDIVLLNDMNVCKEIEVELDSGNDSLTLDGPGFVVGSRFGKAKLDGGSGYDTLYSSPAAPGNGKFGNVKIKHFERFLDPVAPVVPVI